MKKDSPPPGNTPVKPPPKVPDADLEFEDTDHTDDAQQSGSSEPSVPADSKYPTPPTRVSGPMRMPPVNRLMSNALHIITPTGGFAA